MKNETENSYYKAITKCDRSFLQSALGITKCDRSLLQSASGIAKYDRLLLQSASGITNCDRLLLQSASGITKCDNYYKVGRKILFSAGLYKSLLSTYSFGKLIICLSALFVFFACSRIRCDLHKLHNICIIIVYLLGVRYFVFLF